MSATKTKPTANEIQEGLAQFIGDPERYRHPLNHRLIYTPGVDYLAEAAEAYWLIDVVASWLGSPKYRRAIKKDDRIEWMSFWRLEVNEDRSCSVTARADDGVEPFIRQDIEYTDFPLKSIDLFVQWDEQHWTLMLPSEY